MLNSGDIAPQFALPDAQMESISLADFLGKKIVVLYFFNRDKTPGGILEATEFSDRVDAFSQYGAVILGVSMDDCMAHEAFIDEQGLEFDLLSDADGDVSALYYSQHQWEAKGMVRYGIDRSTFVIDKSGVIRHSFYHVTPKGHAAEILDLVKQMNT